MRSHHIMRREGLDHPESSASDAAARQAQGAAIEFVERTIKPLSALHFGEGLVFAIAFVGVHADATTFLVLFGGFRL